MSELWMRELALLLLVWLIAHHYPYWYLVATLKEAEPPPPKVAKKTEKVAGEFQGLTRKPGCTECELVDTVPVISLPPPLIECRKGRRKSVPTELQFCPDKKCDYYGWIGRGNISANGHPNGGPSRQLYCCACKKYFVETTGTLFYRKRYPGVEIARAIATLTEGLGIRAVGRVFDVTPQTVLGWLVEAAQQLEAFNTYMTRNLEIEQVQLDELYGVIRAYQAGELNEEEAMTQLDKRRRKRVWLWTAMDPISKFWLASETGDRTIESAWKIVHKVKAVLKKGLVPLFLTDGNRAYEQPILSHYGEWREPAEGQRKPRWFPLSDLQYAQVVKKRRGRRIVSVSKKAVFGALTQIKERLAPHGWQINTAFVERLNLTIRQLVPGLGRRVNTLLHSPASLAQQVCLAQTYYNFCLPSGSLKIAGTPEKGTQIRTPAMAIGITTHVWTIKEVLMFRPPPFPQGN